MPITNTRQDWHIGRYSMNSNLTSEHLAWILNMQREWKGGRIDGNWTFEAQAPLSSAIVQERMDSRFPASEHVMIWERLLVAIGAR